MSITLSLPTTQAPRSPAPCHLKVAYIPSRFPKLTETFVLYEILELQRIGLGVAVYPLQRETEAVRHAEAGSVAATAYYTPWCSARIIASNLKMMARKPLTYFRTLVRSLGANVGSLRYFGGALAFFPKAVHFADHMQAAGVSFVHGAFASHPAMVAYIIHEFTGIPYSFTAHGSDLHRDQHMLRTKVAAAAFVVTISDYNRRFLIEHCGPAVAERVRVIHCGVDAAQFLPAPQADTFADRRGLEILCIGTLHEVKGHRYLLAACALLRAQGVPFTCHLVGSGPDQKALEALAAQLELTDVVIFHGQQPRAEVKHFLSRADVLVAPSVPTKDGRREGIPVVLMEALAAGVPVVASDLSGIPELVLHEETGLLVPPGDTQGLAAALARLASDGKLRQALAAAGRARVLAEFDLHRNAHQLAACMMEACS